MKQFLIRMISISIIVLLLIPIGLVCVSSVEVEENMQIAAQVEPNVTTKCKLTHIIDVEKLEIIIKNSEKQKEGY